MNKPVAWVGCKNDGRPVILSFERPNSEWNIKPLYTSPLTQEEMRQVLECLKMGLAAMMYVRGTESKNKDFIKEVYLEREEKFESAIAILKGHLHG